MFINFSHLAKFVTWKRLFTFFLYFSALHGYSFQTSSKKFANGDPTLPMDIARLIVENGLSYPVDVYWQNDQCFEVRPN